MLPNNAGLRHIALAVKNLDECEEFYQILGMRTELKAVDYVYLTHNGANLSLHKVNHEFSLNQRLEHIGFAVDSPEAVDKLFQDAKNNNLNMISTPKTFGIGTRSFSVADPDGIEVEFTYHPSMWDMQEV